MYILAIDQGTTSCRAILFNSEYVVISESQSEFTQVYPQEGWVEHDAEVIWETQLECCRNVIKQAAILPSQIMTIGITNQRETIVAWNKETGKPIYHAIVWQDRRTAGDCEQDMNRWSVEKNRAKTGLNIDAYFSAPKIRWILHHVPEAKELIARHALCVGTIDSWLIWKLTGGRLHVTDYSNASRMNLLDIQRLNWDEELLAYYHIPFSILPSLVDSIGVVGFVDEVWLGAAIPISGIAGDQQAALYGHQCFQKGSMKNTFGTGCFLLQNIGTSFKLSKHQLLTTIAWKSQDEKVVYAIEGSVFNAGSALKWLKENLQLIASYDEIDALSRSVPHTDQVFVVPAFTGLGAPYWDMHARGLIIGIHRNTQRAHIVRATVESLAFQTKDIADTMAMDAETDLVELSIDGGVSVSDFLMQRLADILQIQVVRSENKECTALGIAMMAFRGIAVNQSASMPSLESKKTIFLPQISIAERDQLYNQWKKAVSRSREWI